MVQLELSKITFLYYTRAALPLQLGAAPSRCRRELLCAAASGILRVHLRQQEVWSPLRLAHGDKLAGLPGPRGPSALPSAAPRDVVLEPLWGGTFL